MMKPRIPIWQLMMAVCLAGVGFAALKNPTQASAGWVFLGTLGLLLLGFVGVAFCRGRTQLGYLGFVLFGWAYLILALLTGTFRPPLLPTDDLIGNLHDMLHPSPPPSPFQLDPAVSFLFKPNHPEETRPYFLQIGHCVMALVFGLLGSILARLFGTKPTQSKPTERKGTTP